ncbi:MAG: hypothetical protein WCB27_19590 [Thermoguttaceae bacterium]
MARTGEFPLSRSCGLFRMPSAARLCRWGLPCLLALAVGCYWQILSTFFVQDDFSLLATARRPMPNIEMLRGGCFFRPLPSYWIPMLNVSLWGLDPFWHHLTFFVLFLATLAALYFWLQEATGSSPAALLGAGLYAFSKTHLYTLAWIAGGIDVSAGLFLVLTFSAVTRYFRRADLNGGRADRRRLALVGGLFCCALLCKESSVIIAPACLAWTAVRSMTGRRRWYPAEWKLVALMIAMLLAYLCVWKSIVVVGEAAALQFDPLRGVAILRNSVVAVAPAAEMGLPTRSDNWLLLPLLLAAAVAADCAARRRGADLLVLSLSLWALPASIFVLTKYPWCLQLYYSQNSVIGLSLLAALAVRTLQERSVASQDRPPATKWLPTWRGVSIPVATALFAAWIVLASHTICTGIRDRASPALYEADLAKAAYGELHANLQAKKYHKVVFLKESDCLWDSMNGTGMMVVFFPGVSAAGRDRNDAAARRGVRTSSTTFVVRVGMNGRLSVVR